MGHERAHRGGDVERALVFTKTKRAANVLAEQLGRSGISATALHGNKSQNARTKAMDAFRAGKIPVLVATDIASRGIDVDEITHVVNYDMPDSSDTYLHRVGRAGRFGTKGLAITFIGSDEDSAVLDAVHALHDVLRGLPSQQAGRLRRGYRRHARGGERRGSLEGACAAAAACSIISEHSAFDLPVLRHAAIASCLHVSSDLPIATHRATAAAAAATCSHCSAEPPAARHSAFAIAAARAACAPC